MLGIHRGFHEYQGRLSVGFSYLFVYGVLILLLVGIEAFTTIPFEALALWG